MRALALVFVCLIACSAAMGQTKVTPKLVATLELTNDQRDLILRGVRAGLGDPVSARLRASFAGRDAEGRTWVCGLASGKNAFGGNMDEKPFVGLLLDVPPDEGNPYFQVTALGGDDDAFDICRQMDLFSR